MRFSGETGARHFQGRLGLGLRQPHLFDELAERVEREFDRRRGVVHRHDDVWLDEADDLRRFRRVESASSANGDQRDVDRAKRFDLGLSRRLFQVAEMRDGDAVVVEDVDGVTRGTVFAFLFAAAVGRNAGDEDAADLELARAVNRVRRAFDRVHVVVTGRVVADRDDVRFEFERRIADGFVVEWVRHHRRIIALGETKTGMSVPGDFHE